MKMINWMLIMNIIMTKTITKLEKNIMKCDKLKH